MFGIQGHPQEAVLQFELYFRDIEAVKKYQPAVTSIPLVLLRAADEPEDPDMIARWRRLSANKLELHNVPGDHLTMMRAPHVYTLARVLRERFARVEENAKWANC